MGNPQERLFEMEDRTSDAIDLGWLAGMFDGEGSCSMPIRNRKARRPMYNIRCEIVNTNQAAIERVAAILQRHNVGSWMYTRFNQTVTWKNVYCIAIIGYKRNRAFLSLIAPHLTIKRERALVALEWLAYREGMSTNDHHGDVDEQYAARMRALNFRGTARTARTESSTSIR